jgi:PAS domain S-box-containing protein
MLQEFVQSGAVAFHVSVRDGNISGNGDGRPRSGKPLVTEYVSRAQGLYDHPSQLKADAENDYYLMRKETLVLFDKAPCGYHSVNEEGVVVSVNQTLLDWLGYQRDEVVGKKKFTDFIDGSIEESNEKIKSLIDAGKGGFEIEIVCKSGLHFPVVLGIMPAEITDGLGPLFTTTDNQRCIDALQRINTLDQELEAFSYSISHDLRAPLRSIDGYSRILQEDYAEKLDDEGRRVLHVVMNNAKRMGKLIDDLLDFGRLGRKSLQLTRISMTGIVENILQELKAQEPEREIKVSVGELLPAYADSDMMRQVWHNLLENAFKYTGKQKISNIEVRSYEIDDHEVCYEIKDNGVGFDMKYAEKLFGVFQRLHKMQDFSGTGVGLAIVKRIISRHRGRVWAKASLNDGATFYFTLPLKHEIR